MNDMSANRKSLHVLTGLLCLVIVVGAYKLVTTFASNPEGGTLEEDQLKAGAITGTGFTHQIVGKFFPFGYGLVHVAKDGTFTFKEHRGTNNLLEWDIDWKSIKIERDAAAKNVVFSIPAKSTTPDRTNGSVSTVTGADSSYQNLEFKASLVTGTMSYGPIGERNKPELCAATLSTEQHTPIFAIGFRIRTDRERNNRSTPNP